MPLGVALALAFALSAGFLASHFLGALPLGLALSPLPPVLTAAVVAALRPQPRHLRRVGWALVAAQALSLGLLAGV